MNGAFHFGTGPSERKARNLAAGNHNVLVSVATPAWEGLDIVIEGEAVPVTDLDRLGRLVEAHAKKYDDVFGFRLVDDKVQTRAPRTRPLFFEVRARKAFGFGKGKLQPDPLALQLDRAITGPASAGVAAAIPGNGTGSNASSRLTVPRLSPRSHSISATFSKRRAAKRRYRQRHSLAATGPALRVVH